MSAWNRKAQSRVWLGYATVYPESTLTWSGFRIIRLFGVIVSPLSFDFRYPITNCPARPLLSDLVGPTVVE